MSEVHVKRFETQYRLPPAAFADKSRLDEFRTKVLDNAFRQALADNGIREDAELCIRSLVSAVCLRLNRSDESITASWSEAIAKEISRALRARGTSNIVFYNSRRQALLDFATGIACGDLRRVWAWRQLGLCRSQHVTDEAQWTIELVTALCSEPDLLVPTLRAVAEAGWMHRIASRVTERQWVELALAALPRAALVHLLEETNESPAPRTVRTALRVLARSRLCGAISATGSLENAGTGAPRAVAMLAVLEAEPVLLSALSASATISIIAEAIRSPHNETISAVADRSVTALTVPETIDTLTDRSATSVTKDGNQPAPEITDASRSIPVTKLNSEFTDSETSAPPIDLPIDLRQRCSTRYGGLLFLVGVVNDLGLPEEISGHGLLGARPFVWVMHQLALRLIAMAPNDPAALAFAGLSPQTTPPSDEEAPANEVEVSALDDLAARVVERSRLLLERQDEPAETLLEFVCCRRAEVVADPGWIELRFSIDNVATEIRRAGLDLDPGYVWWLGVVIRFVYE